jgi:hypothetical protein
MMRATRFWAAAIATLIALGGARADTYYMVVFGSDSRPMRPRFSHSWATFVRVPGGCPCGPPTPDAAPIEWFTISWLPCKVVLTPHTLFAEPGHNFDLAETFDAVLSQCQFVGAFGPYEIDADLYCRAVQKKDRLESGAVRYKTFNHGRNPDRVSNCVHALSEIEEDHLRLHVGRTNFGETASFLITKIHTPHIICPSVVHCWIADLLGLGQYPIKWRTLDEGRPRPRLED